MERRQFLRVAGTLAIGTSGSVAGCLDDEPEYDVGMTAEDFVPEELTVSVGETVTWFNNSSRAHTVTAYENAIPEEAEYFASGGFDDEPTARDSWWDERGGALDSGEEFSYTFEVPGHYSYVCIPHEVGGMIARVFVEE